jgi:serine phosphatase RsbU (regulator of sigma subunit)
MRLTGLKKLFFKSIVFASQLAFTAGLLSPFKPVQAQVHLDIGQLSIQNFSSKDYKSHPQNWAIAQDNQGLMYFGNNLGVLVYDGINWDLVKTENETTVRSLDVSPKGKVFVGAGGDFGYLDADDHGRLIYVSLSKLFKLNASKLGDVYQVSAFDQGVYFLTDKYIYFYDGKSMKVWETESSFQAAYKINGSYIVNQLSIGLCKMIDDSLIPMTGVNDFTDMRLYDIVHFSDKEMLVLTEKNGIHNLFKTGRTEEEEDNFRNKINAGIKYFNPYNGVYLKDNIFSIGTWGHGLLLVDLEGDIVQHIDGESGLTDEVITDQYLDKNGNLWLTTSNGIARLTIDKRIAAFRQEVNINETVEKVVRFNGKLFAATHTGLYTWYESNKSGTFQRVAGINTECWDLLPVQVGGKSLLLIAGNNAVYQIDEALNLQQIVTCLPWTFHELKADPGIFFVGLDDGLMCLIYSDDGWIIQNNVAGISNTIYSIAQSDDRRVWLGTLNHGVIRMDLKERITHYPYQFDTKIFDVDKGLPDGGVFVKEYVGGVLFGTNDGIYDYDEVSNSFEEELVYKEAMGVDHIVIHRISEDYNGNLWLVGYWEDEFYTGYFDRKTSTPIWYDKAFKPFSNEVFHTIMHEKGGVNWLGGPEGLFRYVEEERQLDVDPKYKVLIRQVVLNKDSLDFAGNYSLLNYMDSASSDKEDIHYPYSFNSISFTFSSQYHQYPEMTLYSHILDGFDDEWSNWEKDVKAIYTNLHEGIYTFRVRAKNIYGIESDEATYHFIISSPWYRSWWALLIYAVGFIVLVYFVVILYTKKLKNIIRERTAEVVVQKEEIEKQKDEVEIQRKLLEVKNADITSSINYAKRLQEALLPNQDLIYKYFKEHFILYKPKDIVSGDFYWMEHVNGSPGEDATLFATVDCTGHGVPGAFVSVVGNGGLNRAVNEFGLRQPAAILDKLNEIVVDTLSRGEQELRDGMDISLCKFDFNRMEMQFAGANNSVYLLRKGIENMDIGLNGSGKFYKEDMCEIKANKQPVGYYEFRRNFKNNTVKLQKGDVIYLFSDGYTDQFGGPNCKKYNVTRFKNFLLSIYDKPMSEQRDLVNLEFQMWQGDEEQIDDVIVAGIRV